MTVRPSVLIAAVFLLWILATDTAADGTGSALVVALFGSPWGADPHVAWGPGK